MTMEPLVVNDFFVAIQSILEHAEERGWGIRFIEKTAHEAIEEWMQEKERERGWDMGDE